MSIEITNEPLTAPQRASVARVNEGNVVRLRRRQPVWFASQTARRWKSCPKISMRGAVPQSDEIGCHLLSACPDIEIKRTCTLCCMAAGHVDTQVFIQLCVTNNSTDTTKYLCVYMIHQLMFWRCNRIAVSTAGGSEGDTKCRECGVLGARGGRRGAPVLNVKCI